MINKLDNISKGLELQDDIYSVILFEGSENHFLGINNDGHLALLLKTSNREHKKFVNFRGKNLQILFDRESAINNEGLNSVEQFTILHLLSDKRSIQNYFIEICKILIFNLGESPKIIKVHKELESVKDIFLNLNKNKIKEEIGLWGELFLIYSQENKEKAISSWHLKPTDRIDFNSGKVKIEVKTTLSNDRKHIFKLNQLRNHYTENVLVCSIMTNEIENGISIKDLINKISNELNSEMKLVLLNKVSSILGSDLLSISYRYFDEKSAFDSLRIYESNEVPAIEKDCIVSEVSNIIFTSNLNKTKYLDLDIKKLIC